MYRCIRALALVLFVLATPHAAQRASQPPAPPVPYPGPAPSPNPGDFGDAPAYRPRTLAIRSEPGQNEDPSVGWIMTRGHAFHRIPRMAASVVVEEDDTNLAITFSAEAFVAGPSGTRLFVRALVDREVADPADVVFTQDAFVGARSFTFTAVVDAGIHTIEMEWLVDDLGTVTEGHLRAASLELRTGKADPTQAGTLTFETAPSGPEESTRSTSWDPVPGMQIPFYAPVKCNIVVTFSAEALVSNDGESFFARALVDGVPLRPSDVVLTRAEWIHCRTMVFGKNAFDPGWHELSIEWAVGNPGETAIVGERSVMISCYPTNATFGQYFVSPPSGPLEVTNGPVFLDVPGMQQEDVKMPANGELSVKVAGELFGLGTVDVELRVTSGGMVLGETVAFFRGGAESGVHSFAFDVKHQFAGLPVGHVRDVDLQWRAVGTGTALIGDRAMVLLVEPGDVPDLAEPAPFGLVTDGLRIEPVVGTRNLLTIFWDPHRPEHPAFDQNAIVDALFDASFSVADYFSVVSGGRFTLVNAGALGYYDALKPADHYWTHPECGEAGNDGFKSGHQEKWYEALTLADPDFDFAPFDADGDGVVRHDELAVLMVIPQQTTFGTTQVSLRPFCDDSPVVCDGVVIEGLVEWYVQDPQQDLNLSTAAHELSHHVLRLGDMYVETDGGGQYENDDTHTEPGLFSLMAENGGAFPHLDPMHKLQLGWIAPTWVGAGGWYELDDVCETRQLLVLPRRNGGDGREYLVLENRQMHSGGDGVYDNLAGANGLVLWHVIPDPDDHDFSPGCMDANEWLVKANNVVRRGVRLLRPSVEYAPSVDSVWNLEEGYELDGFGLTCPGMGTPHNALLWSDYTPSGYVIGSFSTAFDPHLTFHVQVPALP